MNRLIKSMLCIVVSFLFFFAFSTKVNAIEVSSININKESSVIVMPAAQTCKGLLGEPEEENSPAYYMQMIFDIMKYAGIAALLLMVTIDFFTALVAQDKDALKKASSKALKRFVYCVILFFLPMLIDFVLSLFGIYGTCGIS